MWRSEGGGGTRTCTGHRKGVRREWPQGMYLRSFKICLNFCASAVAVRLCSVFRVRLGSCDMRSCFPANMIHDTRYSMSSSPPPSALVLSRPMQCVESASKTWCETKRGVEEGKGEPPCEAVAAATTDHSYRTDPQYALSEKHKARWDRHYRASEPLAYDTRLEKYATTQRARVGALAGKRVSMKRVVKAARRLAATSPATGCAGASAHRDDGSRVVLVHGRENGYIT